MTMELASAFPGCDVVSVIHLDVRGQPALRLVLAEIERAGGELRRLDYQQDARGRFVRLHVAEISDGWSERLVASLRALPGVPGARLEHQVLGCATTRAATPCALARHG